MYEPILTIEDNPIYFFQGLSCETLEEYINFSFKFQDFEYIKDKIDTTYKMSQNKNDLSNYISIFKTSQIINKTDNLLSEFL